jgi:hypothetical protein
LFSIISSARSFQKVLLGTFLLLKCFHFRVRVFTVGERLLGPATIALGFVSGAEQVSSDRISVDDDATAPHILFVIVFSFFSLA